MSIAELTRRIAELRDASTRPRVLIGIAGAPGAGKSMLAEALVARLGGFPGAVQVPMDGFHLADVELARLGRSDRKGAPETFDALGYAALLGRIAAGETVWAPGFERVLDQPIAQAIPVTPETRIVLSEGNYLLLSSPEWKAARGWFDEVWFCEQDEPARLARLISRHIQFGKTPEAARAWVMRSDQANARLVLAAAERADLIVDLRGVDLLST